MAITIDNLKQCKHRIANLDKMTDADFGELYLREVADPNAAQYLYDQELRDANGNPDQELCDRVMLSAGPAINKLRSRLCRRGLRTEVTTAPTWQGGMAKTCAIIKADGSVLFEITDRTPAPKRGRGTGSPASKKATFKAVILAWYYCKHGGDTGRKMKKRGRKPGSTTAKPPKPKKVEISGKLSDDTDWEIWGKLMKYVGSRTCTTGFESVVSKYMFQGYEKCDRLNHEGLRNATREELRRQLDAHPTFKSSAPQTVRSAGKTGRMQVEFMVDILNEIALAEKAKRSQFTEERDISKDFTLLAEEEKEDDEVANNEDVLS